MKKDNILLPAKSALHLFFLFFYKDTDELTSKSN